jgi:cytosine/adenosine deaminase-related metal-dependent hydrolase
MSTTAWIVRGNIVVPTENPFVAEEEPLPRSNKNEEWLGPGLKLLLDHELHVSNVGIITHIAPLSSSSSASAAASPLSSAVAAKVVQLSNTEFLCPGMIDLHIHAPQFIFTGTPLMVTYSKI